MTRSLLAALALVFGLCAVPPLVHAGSKEATKLEKLLQKNKLDKVLELCDHHLTDDSKDPDVREVCANAQYIGLERLHAVNGIPRSELDAHRNAWEGTKAGQTSRSQAAQLALADAGDNPQKRRVVFHEYRGTEAADQLLQDFWEATVQQDTIDAARAFQADFPDTSQANLASKMEQDLAFEATASQDTSQAWQVLLESYPGHGKLPEIQSRWMSTVWREVEAVNTAEAWSELLSEHPEHPRVEEATARRIDVIWKDSEGQGPEGLLAFAKAYPNDPRSVDAWRQVHQALVQVSLNDTEGHATALTLSQDGAVGPWIPAALLSIQVQVPVPGVQIKTHMEFGANQKTQRAEEAWLQLIVEAGLPEWRRPTDELAVTWTPTSPVNIKGEVSQPLCRPDRPNNIWWIVVEVQGGVTLRYPFQVRERCAELTRATRTDVPITVSGRKLRLGWTRDEVALIFPFQESAAPPFQSERATRSCLQGSGADAVCFDFFDQLLVGIDIACWSSEPCFETQGTYNSIVPYLRRPLKTLDMEDSSEGVRTLRYGASGVRALEHQVVDPETGAPDFRFSLVDAHFLSWVRPMAPDYGAGLAVP